MDLRHSRVLMILYHGVPIKTIALDRGYVQFSLFLSKTKNLDRRRLSPVWILFCQ